MYYKLAGILKWDAVWKTWHFEIVKLMSSNAQEYWDSLR